MIVACFCADLNYKPLLESAFVSFAKHNSGAKVYVLKYDDFNEDILRAISDKYNVELIIHLFLDEVLPSKGRFSKAMYGRFHLYNLVSEERFIYLDCDVVVNSDLTELFEMDMPSDTIGMIEDIKSPIIESLKNILGVDNYYNSGVILFNKSTNVNKNITGAVDYLSEHSENLEYPDQDAINLVFSGSIFPLNETYNYMRSEPVAVTPHIVHYAHEKPWGYCANNSYSYLYHNLIARNEFGISAFRVDLSLTKKLILRLKNLLRKVGVLNLLQKVYWGYVK